MSVGSGQQLMRLLHQLQTLDGTLLVGVDPKLKYTDGREKPVPVWKTIVYHEFGTRNEVARPAVSSVAARNTDTYLRSMRSRSTLVAQKRTSAAATMMALGRRIVDDIQKSIYSWHRPPNRPATEAKKGFNDPLIETERMVNAWRAQWYPQPKPIPASARRAAVELDLLTKTLAKMGK